MGAVAELIEKYRDNRKVLLLIVYVALFLDNMLLTTIGKYYFSLLSNYRFSSNYS